MHRWLFCGFLLLGHVLSVQAAGDSIRFAQAAGGTVTAILSGSVDPCTGSNHFPLGPSSATLQGNEYDISTFSVIIDPLPCPAPPQAYEVRAELANVADGDYAVVWTAGSLSARGMFSLRAGVLVLPPTALPTLAPSALAALVALLALAGAVIRRADFH